MQLVTFLSVEFHEPLTMCKSNKTKTRANEMYKRNEMYEIYGPLRGLIYKHLKLFVQDLNEKLDFASDVFAHKNLSKIKLFKLAKILFTCTVKFVCYLLDLKPEFIKRMTEMLH